MDTPRPESPQPKDELTQCLELIAETYRPCQPHEANTYRSTDDFIAMVREHAGEINHATMTQYLLGMGYHRQFISDQIKWCVIANRP